MHREALTADREFADPPAFGEPPGPEAGLPPHAVASRAAVAMTVMTAAARARRSRGGRGPGPLLISCLFAAGRGGCGFMTASVAASGDGRVTCRGEGGSLVGGIRRRVRGG